MAKAGTLLFLYILMLFAALLLACNPIPAITTPPDTTSAPTETATASPAPEDDIPRITAEEFKAKYDIDADLLIVDARGKEEYEADHIKGAVSAPLEDILQGKWILPDNMNREIIFYCS
jgi:3-mercaptopyruvate sulfurtransferase SseA